jgi:hypothetical protein
VNISLLCNWNCPKQVEGNPAAIAAAITWLEGVVARHCFCRDPFPPLYDHLAIREKNKMLVLRATYR